MLSIGQPAPEFRLQDENEQWVTLSSLYEKGPVMVVFYPGDFTPVCTAQLCAYQDAYERFRQFNLTIVGLSRNTPEEHREFKKRYSFSFPLLTDPDRQTARAWGVTSILLLGGISRGVFIVNPQGKIVYRYVEPTSLTRRKPGELLEAVSQLKQLHQI